MNLYQQIKLATQGDAEQEYLLGLKYYLGEEVIQDYKSSVELFTKSAEHGFTRAQFHLGLMYYEAYGVEQDLNKAMHWFKKAARKGDIWGQFYVALINRNHHLPHEKTRSSQFLGYDG